MIGMIGKDGKDWKDGKEKNLVIITFQCVFSSKVLSPRCSIKKPLESKYFKQIDFPIFQVLRFG